MEEEKMQISAITDEAQYDGYTCGGLRLGVSASKTLDTLKRAGIGGWHERKGLYPGLIKVLIVPALPAPTPSSCWAPESPALHFVDDGQSFRLYRVDGMLQGLEADVIRDLEAAHGKGLLDGVTLRWAKGSTKISMGTGFTENMISFTHDEMLDLSTEKMCDFLDAKA